MKQPSEKNEHPLPRGLEGGHAGLAVVVVVVAYFPPKGSFRGRGSDPGEELLPVLDALG